MNHLKFSVCMLLLWSSLFAYDDAAEAKRAAEKGYYNFLKLCLSAKDAHKRHRLDNEDNVENAQLGEPIPLVHLTAEKVHAYSDGSVKDVLTWGSIYYVPVSFRGEEKLMLTVRKFSPDGEYEIAALGDGLLLKQIHAFRSIYRQAEELILCFNPDTRTFLFHMPSKDETNLTPVDFTLPSKRRGSEYSTLSTAKDELPALKELLRKRAQRGNLW